MQRNLAEIKGFEGANICWIEECEAMSKDQWATINPTIRTAGSEVWMLYNPRLVDDFVQTFEHDPENGVIIRHINYDENEFLSDTMLRKIERLKLEDFEQYQHDYLGIPKKDDSDVIIKRSWIEAAIDAHKNLGIEPNGDRQLGFDVADDGKDANALIMVDGIITTSCESWQAEENELLISAARAYNAALSGGAKIKYDSIGVGASCGAKFAEINTERKGKANYKAIKFDKFVAGGGVDDPTGFYLEQIDDDMNNAEFFENLKAQYWWIIAERFKNTYNAIKNGQSFAESDLISIDSSIDNLKVLIKELSTPKKRFSKNGRVMVESKEELKKRLVDSPNHADAFIMAHCAFNVAKQITAGAF